MAERVARATQNGVCHRQRAPAGYATPEAQTLPQRCPHSHTESFAVHEILKQASWLPELPQAGHYRTKDGVEVDLVLEQFDGSLVGVEVKAGTQIRTEDVRGLVSLRDKLGSSFVGGVVLYTGNVAYQLGDRVFAVPLDCLWQPMPSTQP